MIGLKNIFGWLSVGGTALLLSIHAVASTGEASEFENPALDEEIVGIDGDRDLGIGLAEGTENSAPSYHGSDSLVRQQVLYAVEDRIPRACPWMNEPFPVVAIKQRWGRNRKGKDPGLARGNLWSCGRRIQGYPEGSLDPLGILNRPYPRADESRRASSESRWRHHTS